MQSSHQTKLIAPIILITMFLCWNGSMVNIGPDHRPDTNFRGEITDHKSTFKAEDILIGGKDKEIAVYSLDAKIPKNPEIKKDLDPRQNKSLLDLRNILSIELAHPEHPTASEIELNNRKYIEIIVTFINESKQNYLIESAREISCLKVNQGPDASKAPMLEERKLNMTHIRNLTIKNYRSKQDNKKHTNCDETASVVQKTDQSKAEVASTTENILDQMEEKVKNLDNEDHKEDPSRCKNLKSSMLLLLKSLREQLQKLLNMLKN